MRSALASLVVLLACAHVRAQDAGNADVALASDHHGGSGQGSLDVSGISLHSSQLLSTIGLFAATVEGSAANGFRTGTLFGSLQGLRLGGWRWDLVGGDFQFTLSQQENPFSNLYRPDITGRGFMVAARRSKSSVRVFAGQSSAVGGFRIPVRVMLPQNLVGASVERTAGRWQLGARYLELSTDSAAFQSQSALYPASRQFRRTDTGAMEVAYRLSDHLKLMSELSIARALVSPDDGRATEGSALAGATWDAESLTVRANYVRQGAMYLPLFGYALGDRVGPYAEGRYHLRPDLDIYASASQYTNNVEHHADVPTFQSIGSIAGVSITLPRRITLGASLSLLRFAERGGAQPALMSTANRQLNVTASAPMGRHSLRVSVTDMDLTTNVQPQTQRMVEIGDTFVWKRLTVGGAVRGQRSVSAESRDTVFFRGSVSTALKGLSFYAYLENGNDVVNRSVFSTNTIRSTVAGVSAPLPGGWHLQLDAYRNTLNTALNPENIFLFGATGLGPNNALASSNQWSAYLRVGRQFRWGRPLPRGTSLEQYAARTTPLVGRLAGVVKEESADGSRPAINIRISLDGALGAVTDANGRYEFTAVPEGSHDVALDLERLSASYDPGSATTTRVAVVSQGTSRADFAVVRLTSVSGKVSAPSSLALDGIVIHLDGTYRYTTPLSDGTFAFANVRAGSHILTIDTSTLPEGSRLDSPAQLEVQLADDRSAERLEFVLKAVQQPDKPVRDIPQGVIHLERQ
jgi:hypothetical protein